MNKALKEFLEVVKVTAKRLPETKFVMMEPMSRLAVDWYTEGLAEFTKAYNKGLASLQLINIIYIKRETYPFRSLVRITSIWANNFCKQSSTMRRGSLRQQLWIWSRSRKIWTLSILRATTSGMEEMSIEKPSIQDQINKIKKDTQRRHHYDSMLTVEIWII